MSLLKFKDKDIQNISEEELVQRENKNSLSQRVHYGNAANRSGIYIVQKRCY